ncbi:MAG: hypothetical protein E7Z90_05860 [Cyanobacteria bacterium SIG29]|nr:hypothetical protein [Cyanobacteria bacterium SIG29]
MNKAKRITLTLLSLIGLALSIELCVVYFNANFITDAVPSVCAINEAIDCDSVAKTQYSQFLGVPLSLWGILLYLFFLFMTYVDKLQNLKFLNFLKVFKNQTSYIFCVGIFSFLLSIILGCISVSKINSICIFCFTTYFINLIIGIVAKERGENALFEIKNSINDFVEAIKVPRYAFWFSLIVLLFASILTFTSVSNILSPQILKKQTWEGTFKTYNNIVNGNEIGPKDATLVINEYIDFNCGGCFYANLYIHRIIAEFENVKAIQHVLPLEKTCNHNMKYEGHKNSCLKARYAIAAKEQNKYWQMADILFIEAPETEKEIIEQARLFDFDIKKLKEDAHSDKTTEEIKNSIIDADSKEIYGTPTLYIGLKKQIGVDSYPTFKQLVIEQGGIEKKNHG